MQPSPSAIRMARRSGSGLARIGWQVGRDGVEVREPSARLHFGTCMKADFFMWQTDTTASENEPAFERFWLWQNAQEDDRRLLSGRSRGRPPTTTIDTRKRAIPARPWDSCLTHAGGNLCQRLHRYTIRNRVLDSSRFYCHRLLGRFTASARLCHCDRTALWFRSLRSARTSAGTAGPDPSGTVAEGTKSPPA